MTDVQLTGCAPAPLGCYLKALGALRLVAENAACGDPKAMAFWEHDTFVLRSKFNRKELVEFFLNHYSPTPVLSPWGGGSGFYFQEGKARDPVTGKLIKDPNGKYVKTGKRDQATTATKALKALEAATDPRFQAYREAIGAARQLLDALGLKAAPKGAAKSKLLVALRNQLPDAAAQWLDCAAVLARRGSARPRGGSFLPSYAALLGSGGNDGNADFSVNFMQRLRDALISEANQASGRARQWLNAALFRLNAAGSRVMAFAGQYTPGTAGGPNAAAGFEGEYWVNPWDFILLLEGALFFTAAAVRRHGAGGNANAAFPFTVRATGAGYASASGADELDADDNFTEELWVPLWDRPTGRDELFAVLSEGRAQVGAAAASTGVDFARASCAYGTERGLREFVRYGFLVRRGRCKSAVPLGRFLARRHAQADLLSEVERWLGDLRAAAGPTARQAPASVARALRQLESSIFDLCQAEEAAPRLQGVLLALGQAERALARSLAWAAPKDGGVKCPPLCGLSRRWLRDTYDHSAEYRLAAALASTASLKRRGDQDIWVGFRAHLEPVALTDRGVLAWDKACRDTVWHEGDFADVLNRVFQRRLIWAQQLNLRERPDRGLPAPLSDVAAFIYGETDDARLARLTWALALLDWGKKPALTWNLPWAVEYKRPAAPPAVFSLMRLALASSDELKRADLPPVPLTPSIHYHAMTGNGLEASRLACRRLRASRLAPALSETAVSDVLARRAAAALAFPLRPSDLVALKKHVLRPQAGAAAEAEAEAEAEDETEAGAEVGAARS